MTLQSTGKVMAFANASAATASSYAAGFTTTLPEGAFPMGASPNGDRYRGVRLTYSSDANGATVASNVWGAWPCKDADGGVAGYEKQCIATTTGTSSSGLTLPDGHTRSLALYVCDTLAVTTTTTATTPKGPGAVNNTALGSAGAQAFSPADDATPAFILIPDCGNPSHVYVDVYDAGGNRSNVYIEGIT